MPDLFHGTEPTDLETHGNISHRWASKTFLTSDSPGLIPKFSSSHGNLNRFQLPAHLRQEHPLRGHHRGHSPNHSGNSPPASLNTRLEKPPGSQPDRGSAPLSPGELPAPLCSAPGPQSGSSNTDSMNVSTNPR